MKSTFSRNKNKVTSLAGVTFTSLSKERLLRKLLIGQTFNELSEWANKYSEHDESINVYNMLNDLIIDGDVLIRKVGLHTFYRTRRNRV